MTRVSAGSCDYLMVLPNTPVDYIQRTLAETGRPYEEPMLRAMAGRLHPGDLVLDVGANVGNHTMYLAAAHGCRVVAFEPNPGLAGAIGQSAAANGIGNRVDIRWIALGEHTERGRILEAIPDNLGGQQVVAAEDGDFPIERLDDQRIDRRVAAVKIDVEGMELGVLRGGAELIQRDRPLLYVEGQTREAYLEVCDLLRDWDYVPVAVFNATPTHLFVPAEASFATESGDTLMQSFSDLYELRDRLELTTRRVNEANRRYREVAERCNEDAEALAKAHEAVEDLRVRAHGFKVGMARAQEEARGHRAEVLRVRQDAAETISVARVDAERLSTQVKDLRSQLGKASLPSRSASHDREFEVLLRRIEKLTESNRRLKVKLASLKSRRVVRLADSLGVIRSRAQGLISGSIRSGKSADAVSARPSRELDSQ